jgi:hypothetical protein
MFRALTLTICCSLPLACGDRALAPGGAADDEPPPPTRDLGAVKAHLDLIVIPPDNLTPDLARPDSVATTDPEILECVAAYSGWCRCEGDCMDGFGETLWYPRDAGPFPGDISAPPELLEVAVAKHFCSMCVACGESWEIQVDGSWVQVTALEMCAHVAAQDRACGGCLETWWGGAG